jgi:hypothetical protein
MGNGHEGSGGALASAPNDVTEVVLKSPHFKNRRELVTIASEQKWGPKDGSMLPEAIQRYTDEFVPSLETACGHGNP